MEDWEIIKLRLRAKQREREADEALLKIIRQNQRASIISIQIERNAIARSSGSLTAESLQKLSELMLDHEELQP